MEEKKTTPNNENQDTNAEANEAPKKEQGSRLFSFGSLGSMLSEKEQKSLLFYIAVGIILVEFAVTVGALITGIAGAEQLGAGKVQFNFPWAGYLVTVVVAPIIVILLVNLIGMGFYRAVHGEPTMSDAQFDQMPEKARNLFSLVRGAPTIILFVGIIVLGAVLYYLDGVMSLLLKLGDSVETIVIWGTCGLVIAWCLSYCARMWLMYRTRRLEADYAYRREVLERTGMVILDGKNMLGSQESTQYIVERALPSAGQNAVVDMDALPASEATKPEADAVDAEVKTVAPEVNKDADKDIVDAEIIEPVIEPVIEVVEPIVTPVAMPEVKPAVEAEVETVEPETVVVPEPELVAEPVVEAVVADVVEPTPAEPEVIEPKVIEPEAVVITPEAECVSDNVEYEPQTLAIVHIAVNAIFDAKEMAAEPEFTPELASEPVTESASVETIVVVSEPAHEVAEEVAQAEVEASLGSPASTPDVPQTPQAPQAPSATIPKPPVRRARLSNEQKRRI